MDNVPILTTHDTEAMAYECRFTVESTSSHGGDFMRNIGGDGGEVRVTFEGYANAELYDALSLAIAKVVGR